MCASVGKNAVLDHFPARFNNAQTRYDDHWVSAKALWLLKKYICIASTSTYKTTSKVFFLS